MPRKLVAYKFSPEDLALIELVRAHSLAGTNSEAIRIALREYAKRHGLIDRVRQQFPPNPAVTATLAGYELYKTMSESGTKSVKGMAAAQKLVKALKRTKPK